MNHSRKSLVLSIATRDMLFSTFKNALKTSGQTIAYLNVHVLHLARRNTHLFEALSKMDHLYCDSDGLRMVLEMKGLHVQKLTGAGFAEDLFKELEILRPRLFICGGRPGSASRVVSLLQSRFPGIEVVGHRDGDFSEEEEGRVLEEIRSSGSQWTILGLGTPRQEIFMAKHASALPGVTWAVGSLIEALAGREPRAPEWMLRWSLEWLFRSARKPMGHATRVLWEIPHFLWLSRKDSWNEVELRSQEEREKLSR